MNKSFVRLAATGVIAAGMAAPALADSATINTTGPGSTNTVTSSNLNGLWQQNQNLVDLGNWNNQNANTGSVRVSGNTFASGGNGSGSALNENSGQNGVTISNGAAMAPLNVNGGNDGGNGATIYLTGPHSFNDISSNTGNFLSSSNFNDVNANNASSQQATSGNVTISGNTVAGGDGGSGNAENYNSGTNNVDVTNSSPVVTFGDGGGGNSAQIGLTGPHSTNVISSTNTNTFSSNNENVVSANNVNDQSANTGNVKISGNTVAGGASSGSAVNENQADNNVDISN